LVSHCLAALAMHFYSGPPMHLLSGVDIVRHAFSPFRLNDV